MKSSKLLIWWDPVDGYAYRIKQSRMWHHNLQSPTTLAENPKILCFSEDLNFNDFQVQMGSKWVDCFKCWIYKKMHRMMWLNLSYIFLSFFFSRLKCKCMLREERAKTESFLHQYNKHELWLICNTWSPKGKEKGMGN